uniref:RING-type domain-containing protein n=1 Tax=Strigamia maritima TaxID=126957 RepID=T1IWJ2_STRMM
MACESAIKEYNVLTVLDELRAVDDFTQYCFWMRHFANLHPDLRCSPGSNCNTIIHTNQSENNHVTCSKCGNDVHAPADCDMMQKWMEKCAGDVESVRYLNENTKDCPICHVCIEKDGGCDSIRCVNCENIFCWICLGDKKNHENLNFNCEYLPCKSQHPVRQELDKFLFYFGKWEKHVQRVRLGDVTLEKIQKLANDEMLTSEEHLIDWKYLFDAAAVAAECHLTLQFSYVLAYFMECGSRKELLEYQQAQLAAEIGKLSWQIQWAETTDRGSLEFNSSICDRKREMLLTDFAI